MLMTSNLDLPDTGKYLRHKTIFYKTAEHHSPQINKRAPEGGSPSLEWKQATWQNPAFHLLGKKYDKGVIASDLEIKE